MEQAASEEHDNDPAPVIYANVPTSQEYLYPTTQSMYEGTCEQQQQQQQQHPMGVGNGMNNHHQQQQGRHEMDNHQYSRSTGRASMSMML